VKFRRDLPSLKERNPALSVLSIFQESTRGDALSLCSALAPGFHIVAPLALSPTFQTFEAEPDNGLPLRKIHRRSDFFPRL
jgi:hypothetical protein